MYMGYVIRKKRHIQATDNQKYRVIDEKPGGSEKVKAKGTSVKKAIYQRAMLTTLKQVRNIIKDKKPEEVLEYLDNLQKSNYEDRKPNRKNPEDVDEIEGEDMYIPKDKGGKARMEKVMAKRAELEAQIVHAVEEKEPLKVIEKAVFDLDKWLYDTDPTFTKEKDKLEDKPPQTKALTREEEQRMKKLASFARFRKLSAKETAELEDLDKKSKKA